MKISVDCVDCRVNAVLLLGVRLLSALIKKTSLAFLMRSPTAAAFAFMVLEKFVLDDYNTGANEIRLPILSSLDQSSGQFS